MAIKHYKKIYSIYRAWWKPTIQVHLVRETKKTYIDITWSVTRAHKENGNYPWNGQVRCFGRMLKTNEYELISSDYCIHMFGSDLEKLKQAWAEKTTPVNEDGLEFNSNNTDIMVGKLNNQEETETGEWEDN